MEFCPKCKSILKPKTEDGKKILACSCGYKKEIEKKSNERKNKKRKRHRSYI